MRDLTDAEMASMSKDEWLKHAKKIQLKGSLVDSNKRILASSMTQTQLHGIYDDPNNEHL